MPKVLFIADNFDGFNGSSHQLAIHHTTINRLAHPVNGCIFVISGWTV